MSKVLGPVLGAILIVSTPAYAGTDAAPAADQATKLSEAHAIVDVIYPQAGRDSMIKKLQANLLKQLMPPRDKWMQQPGVKEIVDNFIADASAKQRVVLEKYLPLQMDAMATAYTRTFSLAELKDIDAFAHTPAGRHYLVEGLAILGDPNVAKVNTALVADIRATTEAMMPAFKARLVEYLKAHPELATEIEAETKSQ